VLIIRVLTRAIPLYVTKQELTQWHQSSSYCCMHVLCMHSHNRSDCLDKLKYGFANMTCPRPADYRDSEDDFDWDDVDCSDDESVCADCSGEGCPACMGTDMAWGCGGCEGCCGGYM
jgi:hypothetical protein